MIAVDNILIPAEHGPGRCLPVSVAMQMVAVERAIRAEYLQDDEADAGSAALPVAREVWRHPTFNDLERRRTHTDEPCGHQCGRCSRCARAEQAVKNLARFGSPDWPGGNVRGVAA